MVACFKGTLGYEDFLKSVLLSCSFLALCDTYVDVINPGLSREALTCTAVLVCHAQGFVKSRWIPKRWSAAHCPGNTACVKIGFLMVRVSKEELRTLSFLI